MRRMPLTVRGIGALVLGLGLVILAYGTGSIEALAFGVLFLVAPVLSALSLWLHGSREHVTRTVHPESLAVGEGGVVVMRVSTSALLPVQGATWRDLLPEQMTADAEGHLEPFALSPARRSEQVLRYPVVGTRRGPERIGPLELTETDGLGLARRRRRVGSPTPVMVTPRIVPLAPLAHMTAESGLSVADAQRSGQG
ncbi:MAG: hypothetical protein QM607_09690, partial [Microbacterium sp.]